MTAQTFTALGRASPTFPVYRPDGSGALAVYWGRYTIPETPEVGDIYPLCRVPRGFTPLFGALNATDIDSGTETFELDIGYAANGVDTADPDYFVNSGVMTGDLITDFVFTPATTTTVRLFMPTAPVALGAETLIQAECIAVANAGATGSFLFWVMGTVA